MTIILDGRAASSAIMEDLKAQARELKEKKITPTLALLLVGDDKHSAQYIDMKAERCREAGVEPQVHHLPSETAQSQILNLIERLNKEPSIHGIMVQLPLPKEIDEPTVVEAISPSKDVDGLSPMSLGKVLMGEEGFLSAGVEAIMELLHRHGINPEKKHWVIVGLSNIVGKPLAALLANMHVAFTCCGADEPELAENTRRADVLVVDVGRKWAITADLVKKGCVVLDNGNNYEGRKVYGDVDFEAVKEVASAITPVPGGIGPLLITMLVRNTIKAAAKAKN
jgi:methylenetetrahydrofolate dehydrogenase (NADP+)/methenyltetrahydrofolate cyclohydrolase